MNGRTRGRARRAQVGATFACLLLATAACGSGSGSGSESSSEGSSAAEVNGTELLSAGKLTYCADISAPPMTFYDENQTPVGVEIDLGDALAEEMGLTAEWKNTAFSGIIPALQSKQCDAILSQLYIKPEREEVVDFVPYMYSGNTIVVASDNPKGIDGLENLCGTRVAAQTGTTVSTYLEEASATCESDGEPAVDVRLFGKDTEAFQQLATGQVDAYGTTVETAAYALTELEGQFVPSGEPFGQITTGIATNKDATGLHDGIADALAALRENGTYDEILADWDLQDDALPEEGAAEESEGN
jgi:polar amino acid transport system substrate-binding protein